MPSQLKPGWLLRNNFENTNSQNNLSFIGCWKFLLIGYQKIFHWWNPWSWIIFNVNHSVKSYYHKLSKIMVVSGTANILTDSMSQETEMRFTISDKHINVMSCKIIQIVILQLNVSNSMRFRSGMTIQEHKRLEM